MFSSWELQVQYLKTLGQLENAFICTCEIYILEFGRDIKMLQYISSKILLIDKHYDEMNIKQW